MFIKTQILLDSSSLSFHAPDVSWQNSGPQNSYLCAFSPRFCFPFLKMFFCSCFFSAAMEVAARFIALARQDLLVRRVFLGVLQARHGDSTWWRHPSLAVLTRGQFPSSRGPPRHHRIKMEGRDPPVSGECPAPSQNQPAIVCGSP